MVILIKRRRGGKEKGDGEEEKDTYNRLAKFLNVKYDQKWYSSVLAWRIPGAGEPGGLTSMGSHRVRHD